MAFKVFVDTDVIIDFLIDRQPHAASSSKIFDFCEKRLLTVCTSALCINNVHYIIRKVVGEKNARRVIDELLDLIEVLDVSKDDLRNALKSYFKDFEDAIQHAVAIKENGLKSIITRNTKDYKKSKISVFTPDIFIKVMENEQ